jgi:hypothetical protein
MEIMKYYQYLNSNLNNKKMPTPLEGLQVKIQKPGYTVNYTNTLSEDVNVTDVKAPITNYEYEVKKNEEKRNILIIKPSYLNVFLKEFKNIMQYDRSSSNYISEKVKKVPNE